MASISNISLDLNKKDEKKVLTSPTSSSKSKAEVSGQEHSFLMDQSYVEEMEDSLLNLLHNFKQGRLNAFDENCSLDKMKQIKVLQKDLAQLHFDLENEDANKSVLSEDARTKRSQEKMDKLMTNMETLCSSVQSLHQHVDSE